MNNENDYSIQLEVLESVISRLQQVDSTLQGVSMDLGTAETEMDIDVIQSQKYLESALMSIEELRRNVRTNIDKIEELSLNEEKSN